MFITKKAHSAPDVPPGRRRHAGAAAARGDGARRQRCWRRRPRRHVRSRASSASSIRTAWRPGYWEPEKEGALAGKLPYILEVAQERQGPDGRPQRPVVEIGGAAGGHDRIRSLGRRRVPDRASSRARPPAPTPPSAAPRSISMIAQKIGQETLLPSLQLAVEDPNSSSSNCGEGYSCSYTNSISWVGAADDCRHNETSSAPARCRWS